MNTKLIIKYFCRLGIMMLILTLFVFSMGCGDGGGGDGDATGDTGNTGNDGNNTGGDTGGGPAPPAFTGFDFDLAEGYFWEYGWDYQSSYVASGSSSSSSYSGTFRVTLASPITVDGVLFYKIQISGTTDAGDRKNMRPIDTYVAVSDHKILILDSDSTTIITLFDAQTGQWPGSGFFTDFPGDTLFSASDSTISNDYINELAYMVKESSSSNQCEYFSGIGTICGGDYDENMDEREYYIEGIGPVGYYAYFSISDPSSSDGGWWASNTTHIGLTASSLRGNSVDYTLEIEPNNLIAQATQILLPAKIRGKDVSETYLGGTTEVPIGMAPVAEVEPNDSPLAPQPVDIPSLITADALEGDAFTPVSGLPIAGGDTYEATFEDWYEITLGTDATVNASLDFPGTGADLDMYLFSTLDPSTVETHTKSTDDNVASETYEEEMSRYLSAGTYYIAIDAYLTPQDRADYSLEISTMDTYVDICDWFSFSLVSEAQVTITVTGGPSFVLMDNTGSNPLTSGREEGASITLSAGSYHIGVSEGGEYTLDVTSP